MSTRRCGTKKILKNKKRGLRFLLITVRSSIGKPPLGFWWELVRPALWPALQVALQALHSDHSPRRQSTFRFRQAGASRLHGKISMVGPRHSFPPCCANTAMERVRE